MVEVTFDGELLGSLEASLSTRLHDIVEEASHALRHPVAIDDRHFRLLAHTEHVPEEVDEVRLLSVMKRPFPHAVYDWLERHEIYTATEPFEVEGNADIGLDPRLCAPIRCHGHLLGFLWLTDRDRSMTTLDRERAGAFADEAGIVLYRDLLLHDLGRSRERELLRDVLSDDAGVRQHAVSLLSELDLFTADGRVVAFVAPLPVAGGGQSLEAVRLAFNEALARTRRQLTPKHGLHLVRPDHALLVVALGDPALRTDGVAAFARRLRDEIAGSLYAGGPARCVVAAGGTVRSLEDAAVSYAQALRAATVATTVSNFGDAVCWDDLGIYRVLAELPIAQLGPDAVPAGLRTLIEDPRTHVLVQTLECYLDHAGDVQRTSAALYLHRTSLYHRLRRLEQLAGVDLATGDDRLALHLGLKIARLQGLRWTAAEG